jgi:tetratricopeptide (TPR) repeat protein
VAKSIWTTLNIPASSDERTIKRAYATLLKANNPEVDPAGFQALRAAYEQALQYAKYAKDYPDDIYEDPYDDPEVDDDDGEYRNNYTSISEHEAPIDIGTYSQSSPKIAQTARRPAIEQIDPQRREHQNLLMALDDAVRLGAQPGDLEATLQAVLKSPAMLDIGIYTQTELHILNILSANNDAARSISDSAFQAFGWDKAENQGRGSAGQEALWLRERWQFESESVAFLARIKNPKHEFYPAWKEASVDPATRSALSKFIGLRHLPVVQRLFNTIHNKAPFAFEGLNDDAVDWLTDRLHNSLPKFKWIRLGFIGVLILLGIALLAFDAQRSESEVERLQTTEREADPQHMAIDANIDKNSVIETRTQCIKRAKSAPIYRGGEENERAEHIRNVATDICKSALELRPNSLVLQSSLGVINLKKRYFGSAMEHFQRVLDVSPNDDIALYGMALARGRMGDQQGPRESVNFARRSSESAQKHFDGLGLAYDIQQADGASVVFDPPKIVITDSGARNVQVIALADFEKSAEYYGISPIPAKGYIVVKCLVLNGINNCSVQQETPTGAGLAEVAIHVAQKSLASNLMVADTSPGAAGYLFVIRLER